LRFREANPHYQKQWYKDNRERKQAVSREWVRANRDQVLEYQRQWRKDNPDLVAETYRRWRQGNPEKVAEFARRRRARVHAASIVPFTAEQLNQRMAYWGFKCWMCSGPFEAVDHVKPLAKGGPHVLANLRPACNPCNRRKSARWDGVEGLAS
jgi:5-methylcytosine-specific restriction endonuclease McrA